MSISVERIWWRPLDREEKIWVTIALIWCLGTFFMMPVWHMVAKQNTPDETYKVSPADFEKLVNAFNEKYKVREENGVPVVAPPAGSDIYLAGTTMWTWTSILELEAGKEYRLHLSSIGEPAWQHGFSLVSPKFNANFMVIPGYDYVIKIRPTEAGEYGVICNEFCGIGHHLMAGKIIVKG
jgi:cytochrome c oxidase subunit 2